MIELGRWLTMQKISHVFSGMLGIWKNFLFGWDGKGRPTMPLVGLIILALFYAMLAFAKGAYLVGLLVLLGWTLSFPALVYIYDLRASKR